MRAPSSHGSRAGIAIAGLAAALLAPIEAFAQSESRDARLRQLEAELRAAQARVADLEAALTALSSEVAALREQAAERPVAREADAPPGALTAYADRIVVPDLGADSRGEELQARPEFFVQSRYHANPIDEASPDDVTRNFAINRMEVRWAGQVAERLGMGFELQFHPAAEGAAEELINDAYVEYYASPSVTLRAGQFVKPFGFDIQHSSSVRESPERGMFAGYFFPGQRDRGVMLAADLGRLTSGLALQAGVLNGNRFFNDDNDVLNYDVRLRKRFAVPLAVGLSLQRGTQLAAPAFGGTANEDLWGVDVQYAFRRLGVRAEYVKGDTPSTLLSLEPEFAPAFVPGEESSGWVAFFNYSLTPKDDLYWRWDRFRHDPVSSADVRAFNVGYLRSLGEFSRLGIDYQTKSDVSYNDDELNTRFSLTWNFLY